MSAAFAQQGRVPAEGAERWLRKGSNTITLVMMGYKPTG
jgi:hypothetical protein